MMDKNRNYVYYEEFFLWFWGGEGETKKQKSTTRDEKV